jgi:hypothetical protein
LTTSVFCVPDADRWIARDSADGEHRVKNVPPAAL